MKGELEGQMPVLKKQNLRNADYANRSVTDLFTKDQLDKAIVKQVNYSSSCIAYNDGNRNFKLQNLPQAIQFSSVKAILPIDVNNDGITDLVVAGNEFNFQPQLGRLDASTGDVLINDGKGNFKVPGQSYTGLGLHGQVRHLVMLKRLNKTTVLFLQNDELPLLYQLQNKINTAVRK